ncbi:hypothetical protein [Burkholderia sp. WSM2232]|uniref:hypothetical protein n=1 Tax=Burkholderia sp. WSM2232 TaxID=944436 RepID=UPI00042A2EA8|nr:hypothetical protein [Burkholderia sp. WSM2232]
MPSEFEFLDKHFYETDIPELAAQAARERFGDYPPARASTVIYGIRWAELVDLIERAVINHSYGPTIFSTPAFATIGEYRGQPQWNIVLTGLRYVNASMKVDRMTTSYSVEKFSNGTVIVNARVVNGVAPMLGDIVHLEAATGTSEGPVELKNAN